MMSVTSPPQKDIRRKKERGSDLGRVQGRLPGDMQLELTCEGCTGGHLLKGGHADMRALGSDFSEPDFWPVCWEWRLLHKRGLQSMLSNYIFFLHAGKDTAVLEPKKYHFQKTFLASIRQSHSCNFLDAGSFQIALTWLKQMARTPR